MIFKCTKCKSGEVEYLRHRSKIVEGKPVYMDKNNNPLRCSECGSAMDLIPPEIDGFPQVFVNSFNSLNNDEKRKVLQKREREHQKTNKQFHEYKRHKDHGKAD